MSRYSRTKTRRNGSESSKQMRNRRGNKEFIQHYRTPRLPHPEKITLEMLDDAHVWSVGDKFYKLAQTYYNDPKLWWIIAWYNQKPTEGHVELGDTILIPRNVDGILSRLGY
jgi:hypothetical protein